jgi:hypothetical protein
VKQILTIVLALALCAPHAAKLLAYADCSVIMLTNGDPLLCDCNKVVIGDAAPVLPNQPDKQKELSLKADWKFITPGKIRYQAGVWKVFNVFHFMEPSFSPQSVDHRFFHPPALGLL